MKVLSGFVFLMTLIGCVGCGPDEPIIEAKFKPLILLYVGHSPNKGDLDELKEMRSGNPGEGLSGYTAFREQTFLGKRVEKWTVVTIADDLSECEWKRTVLHELGHAIHDLPHSEDRDSIMYLGDDADVSDEWCNDIDNKLLNLWK